MEDSLTRKLILRPVGVVRSALKTPLLGAGAADLELKTRIEMIREQYQ